MSNKRHFAGEIDDNQVETLTSNQVSESAPSYELYLFNLPPELPNNQIKELLKRFALQQLSLNFDQIGSCRFVHFAFDSREKRDLAKQALDGWYIGFGCYAKLSTNKVFIEPDTSNSSSSSSNHNINYSKFPYLQNQIIIKRPRNTCNLRIIHSVIEFVLEHGAHAEILLMATVASDKRFDFLFNKSDPSHNYYRWKLFSLVQKDQHYKWRSSPFQMFSGGPWWVPPAEKFVESDHISNPDSDLLYYEYLSEMERREMFWLLRKISLRRGDIACVMAFVFDHVDASADVFEILTSSICSPFVTKSESIILARLYVFNDIQSNLHCLRPQRERSVLNHLEKSFTTLENHFKQLGCSVFSETLENMRSATKGSSKIFAKESIIEADSDSTDGFSWESADLPVSPVSSIKSSISEDMECHKETSSIKFSLKKLK